MIGLSLSLKQTRAIENRELINLQKKVIDEDFEKSVVAGSHVYGIV